MIDSHKEQLDNSNESNSHNKTSYHVYVGGSIIIMTLILCLGGMVKFMKYRQTSKQALHQDVLEYNKIKKEKI